MVKLDMREMPISRFKATCLAVLADVRKTRVPVRVTRFGKPIADIVPPGPAPSTDWLGCMRGEGELLDGVRKPIGAFKSWRPRRT